MNSLADKVTNKLDAWQRIGAPTQILSWIEHGVPLTFTESAPKSFCLPNSYLDKEKEHFIVCELKRLADVGAIEQLDRKPFCVSPISCVPKKTLGKHGEKRWRLITDLRELNSTIKTTHFKNDDIRVVLKFLEYEDQLISVDIKDSFQHVLVNEAFRDFLGFSFKGLWYRWRVLPFGLSLSPYYFYKFFRCVITYLRSNSVKCSCFVDDIVLAAESSRITDHTDLLIDTLTDLGVTINYEKSTLVHSTSLEYIGYIISTENDRKSPGISVPKKRLQALRHDIARLLKRGRCTARTLAKIAGRCVAMSLAIVPGKLLLRGVYSLLRSRESWESVLYLDHAATSDLQWWFHAAAQWNGRFSYRVPPEIQVFTDASSWGWGAVCGSLEAAGYWNKRLSWRSSNYRELMAVLLAVITFKEQLKNRSVEIMTDNIVTMAYINGQGGPSLELSQVAKAIWEETLHNNTVIVARHVAGVLNTEADALSRLQPKHEWMLHPRLFSWLESLWGPHSVDRFASYLTTQLPRYNSRYCDPFTEGINALGQQNWASENNYVNAPFCLLQDVMDVIIQQQATATIIAPYWPSQPWCRLLETLSTAKPVPLPNTPRAFISRSPLPEPSRNRGWKLFAWRVHGGKI